MVVGGGGRWWSVVVGGGRRRQVLTYAYSLFFGGAVSLSRGLSPSAINDPLTAGMPFDSIPAELLQRVCCGLKVRAALSSEVVCGHVRGVHENRNANEIPHVFQPWVSQHKGLWACISPQPQVLASYFAGR